jgi:hypothetical protein
MDTTTWLATGHLPVLLLLGGLLLPRFTLFVAWLLNAYPPNPLPDLVNFALWLFVPRFLIAYYIYVDVGINNLWFWAYVITGVVGLFGETGYARHRVVRRTTVSRDGRTTTTVEEEEV